MGAANQFSATAPAPVTLGGTAGAGNAATFSVAGFSQGSKSANGVGALTLSAGSANNILDFGSKDAVITFTSFTTNGATLTINNYENNNNASSGPDELIFDQIESGNLADIVFTGFGSATEKEIGNTSFYEVFPVPEPATILSGWLLAGALGWSQRRRLSGLRCRRG